MPTRAERYAALARQGSRYSRSPPASRPGAARGRADSIGPTRAFRTNLYVAPPRVLKSETPILGPLLKVLDVVGDLGELTGKFIREKVIGGDPIAVGDFLIEMIIGVPRELNEVAGSAGDAVAALIKGSGEGIGTQVHPFVRAVQPRTVAIYLASQLLTVVSSAVAAEMLAGMKRRIRDKVRVRT